METYYNVFHRTWWQAPGIPGAGKRHYIQRHVTREDALELCQKYRSTHEPGELSDKAEFEKA